MGNEDAAEALSGPGHDEGGAVEAVQDQTEDDPPLDRDGPVGPGSGSRQNAVCAAIETAVVLSDDRSGGGELVMNAEFLRFAAHWGFMPRSCRPYRARTKGNSIQRAERLLRWHPYPSCPKSPPYVPY